MNPKDKGIISELKIMSKLVSQGIVVSQPYGDNAPYDFIIDINGELLKIQVKTAEKRKNGSIKVPLCKRVGAKRLGRELYSDLGIDAVIAYSIEDDQCYFINLHKYKDVQEFFIRPKKTIKTNCKNINIAEEFIMERALFNYAPLAQRSANS
jgi:hypothetical protein